MPRFKLENHRTKEFVWVEMGGVKEAHEFGQAKWPGEVVSVEEATVYGLKEEWSHLYSRLLKDLAAAKESVSYPLDNNLVKYHLLSARELLDTLLSLHKERE